MACRLVESFDHYITITQKWTGGGGGSIAAAAARTGANGYRKTNQNQFGPVITIDAQGEWFVATAFRASNLPGGVTPVHGVINTMDGVDYQGTVRLNSDGTFSLLRGSATGVVLVTSARSILLNVWYYLELRHLIANAGGVMELLVNGELWATFTGDTQATANATANQIQLGDGGSGNGMNLDHDDIYILDGTGGAPNNTYWGVSQIELRVSNGAGTYTEWATLVGAATHWQAVNEVPPDENVSYVEDSVVDRRDTFNFQDLSVVSATINAIQVLIRARETAAAGTTVARLYRRAGVDNQGANIVLSTSYSYLREIMAQDPIAVGPWTVANVNAAEFGVRVRP